MTKGKVKSMKDIIIKEWDNYADKYELANMVMEGFIFGKYATSEHYPIDDIVAICKEVDAEKNSITD
jgi:hypothetical protein